MSRGRLDEFEGAEYVRTLVPVEDEGGAPIAVANIYALRPMSRRVPVGTEIFPDSSESGEVGIDRLITG